MNQSFENHFMVFSRTRSGTTVFGHLLNSSKAIHCYDEILNSKHEFNYYAWLEQQVVAEPRRVYPAHWENNFQEYVRHLERAAIEKKATSTLIGWDIKVENLPQYVKEWGSTFSLELLDFVSNLGASIIYVRRRNVLRRHVSNALAHKRKLFHQKPGAERFSFEKVHIDARAALRMALHAHSEDDSIEDYVRGKARAACFYYEEFFQDSNDIQSWSPRVIQRLNDHFQIDDLDVAPRLQKVAPQKLDDAIKNIDEIRQLFSRSHIAWMIED